MNFVLNTKKTLLLGLVFTIMPLHVLAAGNIEAGKEKSVPCASCHGFNGISNSYLWPNLAGQQQTYLIKQLKEFRSGERKNPMMEIMTKELSDSDINDLSIY